MAVLFIVNADDFDSARPLITASLNLIVMGLFIQQAR